MADYPIEDVNLIPKNKHADGRQIARNLGVVVVKCVINELCPFVKSPKFNDIIILNKQTTSRWPEMYRSQFMATLEEDGIYLIPKLVRRHTFLLVDKFINGSHESADLEIEASHKSDLEILPYKREQTFYATHSVFESYSDYLSNIDSSDECSNSARWTYSYLPNSDIYDNDVYANVPSNPLLTNRKVPVQNFVQVPTMNACARCEKSVHWRVRKMTSLFRGEDFFIEFRNMQRVADMGSKIDPTATFKDTGYSFLDANLPATEAVLFEAFGDVPVPKNIGINIYEQDQENGQYKLTNSDINNLTNQQYYVIEFGEDDPEHHYFIILTEKNQPTFIHEKDGIAFLLGRAEIKIANGEKTGESISSKFLLDADFFRIFIRNHLGMLSIVFQGPGFETVPWIVRRQDPVIENGSATYKSAHMYVSHSLLSIWGGHRQCQFLFGPLQYHVPPVTSSVSFRLPPPNMLNSNPQNLPGEPAPDYFTLPADASDFLVLLDISDDPIEVLTGTAAGNDLFTQEAQFYIDTKTPDGFMGNYLDMPIPLKETQGDLTNINYSKLSSIKAVIAENSSLIEDTRNNKIAVLFTMKAGNHIFEDSSGTTQWILDNCKTPVATGFRLLALTNEEDRFPTSNIDVSNNILSFRDTWSAEDYTKINHSGNIKFLLNPAPRMAGSQAEYISSLRDKAFYITVWAGYKDRDAVQPANPSAENICNYAQLPYMFRLFTGICYGGSITYEYGKKVMESTIFDFSKVLEDQRFFNAPFFDGVCDINAIYEIMQLAGFKSVAPESPSFLLRSMAENSNAGSNSILTVGLDGRTSYYCKYVLPSGYQRLTNPVFRAADGSPLMDEIRKIAATSGKLFFFDAYGVAHFEDYRDQVMSLILGGNVEPLFKYTTDPLGEGMLVHSNVVVDRGMIDVLNHIKVMSNTPEFQPFLGDDVNYESLEDPNSSGFLGYLKTFYQVVPFLGNDQASINLNTFYKTFFKPPVYVKLQTFGQPVRALDIIGFQDKRNSDEHQLLRVTTVENEINIDESKQQWQQKLDCEWFQPITQW